MRRLAVALGLLVAATALLFFLLPARVEKPLSPQDGAPPRAEEIAQMPPSSVPESAPPPAPLLSLEGDAIDFGRVDPAEENTRRLRLTNASQAHLSIAMARSSCPCVKASLTTQELAPGQETDLIVQLALDHYPKNKVHGRVYIDISAPKPELHRISVSGEVEPEYLIVPPELDFGQVKRGQAHTASFQVRQNGPQALSLLDVEAPDDIDVSFQELPGASGGPKTYEVTVALEPDPDAQRLNTTLKLRTNIERIPQWPLRVRATFTGIQCAIEPQVVVFDATPPGNDAALITITGSQELEILDAASSSPSFNPRIMDGTPAPRHEIALHLPQDATPGDKIGRLSLTLREGPLVETREVSVYGTIAVHGTIARPQN